MTSRNDGWTRSAAFHVLSGSTARKSCVRLFHVTSKLLEQSKLYLSVIVTVELGRRDLTKNSSSGMLRRVALERTDVSENNIPSIIRETRIGKM
jgi:hypothetical protein